MQRPDWFAVLVAALVLGAGAYLSTFSADVIRCVGIALMAVSLWGLIIWFLWERRRKAVPTVLLFGGIAFAVLAAVSLGAWFFWPSDPNVADAVPIQRTDKGLFVDCNLASLPVKIPADGRLFQMQFWLPLPAPHNRVLQSGVGQSTGKPGTDSIITNSKWPFVQQCQITNYDDAPAVSIDIELSVQFVEAKPTDSGMEGGKVMGEYSWPIHIAKIDPSPGQSFVFYAHNLTYHFVYLSFPETATIQRLGDSTKRTVRITHSNIRPIFFPPFIDKETLAPAP
jgi:hypothetical protein